MGNRKKIDWRPNWLTATLGAAIGVVIAGSLVLAPQPAEAVHDGGYGNFELDGNPTDPLFPSGSTANLPDDWDSVFQLPYTGLATSPVYPTPRGTPTPGDEETFVFDDGTNNVVDYGFSGQSNKDIQVPTQWLYDNAKLSPDKDNITHAYAKAYRMQVGGVGPPHLVIDFGADRYSNNGDAALGFWFFQDNVGRGPANRRGVGAFTGDHIDGDILVQVDFIQGGTRANKIQIFEWQSDGQGSHGTLNQLAYKEGSGDAVCTDGDTACAKTNSVAWPSPWAYTPKSGPSGIFGIQSFFEGGIDITALIGHELCISTFMAETRTSHSETGELKDFALGEFDTCSIDLVRKSCQANANSPLYLAATNRFQTEHFIDIKNDGFGSVFDVAIQDNAVTSTSTTTGSSCKITAITGGVNPVNPGSGIQLPVPVADDPNTPADESAASWIPIADALSNTAGQETMRVTVQCNSAANPFVNSATVRAAPITGVDPTISDFYGEIDTASEGGPPSDVRPQCVRTLRTGLVLTKACPDPVVFEVVGGVYKPKVCVDITIKNTGESPIDIAEFTDDYNDSGVTDADLRNKLTVGTDGRPELQPDELVTVKDCYNPNVPDGAPPILDPDRVTYGDKVKASGRPHSAPSTLVTATEQSTSCPLCPTGLDGAPAPAP